MTAAPDEVTFGLSAAAARKMSPGGAIGLFLGLACLGSAVAGAASDDGAPVAAVVVFAVLGLFFLALGLLLANGARVQYQRVHDGNQHRVCVGPAGLRHIWPSGQQWFVGWHELTKISIAASDGGLGHDPRFQTTRLPGLRRASLNSGLARGDLTLVRLDPIVERQFGRDHVDMPGGRMDRLLNCDFGWVLPMDDAQRRTFADCVRGFSGRCWGGLWDETQRARTLGPSAGYDG